MRLRLTVSLLLLLFAAPAVSAHPLPNCRYYREIVVRLHPQKVEVRYVLMLSFWTIFTDSQKLFTPEEIEEMGGHLSNVTTRYCEKMGPVLAENLEARLNGQKLHFRHQDDCRAGSRTRPVPVRVRGSRGA